MSVRGFPTRALTDPALSDDGEWSRRGGLLTPAGQRLPMVPLVVGRSAARGPATALTPRAPAAPRACGGWGGKGGPLSSRSAGHAVQ
jgi:hypothetical protein